MNTEHIILIASIKAKEGMADQVKRAAFAIVEASRAEPGCINYDIHQSIEDPNVLIWHETWADRAAIDEHFAQPFFAEFASTITPLVVDAPQITLTKMITCK